VIELSPTLSMHPAVAVVAALGPDLGVISIVGLVVVSAVSVLLTRTTADLRRHLGRTAAGISELERRLQWDAPTGSAQASHDARSRRERSTPRSAVRAVGVVLVGLATAAAALLVLSSGHGGRTSVPTPQPAANSVDHGRRAVGPD